MEQINVKQGICPNSLGADDGIHNEVTTLFCIKGSWICGDCANERLHDSEEAFDRYGIND